MVQNTQIVNIKLQPSARKNAVTGWEKGADGQDILKVQITTAPEKGKANKALTALLAKHWGIPKSAITLIRGETSRLKVLEVRGLSEDALIAAPPSAS